MSGWIKIHRKIAEWEWYAEPNTLCLFIHLLVSANHKPNKWRGIDIMTGQVATGRKALSQKTGLSEQQIRTSLANLKSTNEVTIRSTNKYSIITITKWLDYQDTSTSKPTNTKPAKKPTDNQQSTTNKNEKKERIDRPDEDYFFVKSVIRIDKEDWLKWLEMFPNITDSGLEKILLERGQWYEDNPSQQTNWFLRTQQYLSSVNKRGG